MLRVEAPADEGLLHPLLESEQVLVTELEPAADRLSSGKVEDLGCGDPRRCELEDLGQHAHHGIGLTEGTVGQPDLEQALRAPRPVAEGLLPEGRLDQGRKGLDIGAHDDDVPRFEGGIVLQQVQDRVAQHLDLAAPPVAGVDADAVVLGLEQRCGVVVVADAHRGTVGADVVLDLLQQGAGSFGRGGGRGRRFGLRRATEHELHLTRVPPPRRQQRVVRRRGRWVLTPHDGARGRADRGPEAVPEGG